METIPYWLPVVFFGVALLYGTVGFGGGSSYLAVLALLGLPHIAIPQTALVCNLIVSGGGVWHFRRGGHLRFGKTLPFIVLSVPMAYLGGRVWVGIELFTFLLGLSLLIAAVRMFLPGGRFETTRRIPPGRAWWIGVPAGGLLGFLAGIIGIGGGIFLAPLLLLTGWANAKQAAGAASLFIIVNSAAGLMGQLAKGVYLDWMIVPLGIAAWAGGQIGSRLGSYHLPLVGLRRLLAGLVLAVSVKLIGGVL